MKLIVPHIPPGVHFDQRGLTLDLADEQTCGLIRAAFHQLQVLTDAAPLSQPVVKSIDPQVADLITKISKDTK